MKTKDTSTIATALSWLEGPDFIESSERLAGSLISSFPLSRVEALTIVITEAMCNHNVIATKKKIREVLTSQFGIKLTDADMDSFTGNPIDNLAPLAKAGVPILAVCGDSDRTVPYEENTEVLRSRYLTLSAPVEVILKPGGDHHPHSLENPEPVVNFILRHQSAYKPYVHCNVRGSLQNSLVKFEKERKGRVAFLGGSITEMKGWKDMVEQQLKQRFPYTEFDFNTFPVFATLRYKPIKSLRQAYLFTNVGYAVKVTDASTPGFTGKLGIGYTVMLARHFGLNFSVAYDYKDFRHIETDVDNPSTGDYDVIYKNCNRHSVSFGVGFTF